VEAAFDKETGVFEAISEVFQSLSTERALHLDKVAFARYVLSEVNRLREDARRNSLPATELVEAFDKNFRALFSKLNAMRRDAEREARGERVSFRVDRAKRSFILDHPVKATKEQAVILLEEVEVVLDDSHESDAIRTEIQALRRDFHFDIGLKEEIADFDGFKQRLERLKYAGRLATQEEAKECVTAPSPVLADTVEGAEKMVKVVTDGEPGSSRSGRAV
jgi:hypothetical protein